LTWAKFTQNIILLPVIHSKIAGGILMIAGLILMMWAFFALYRYGHGLPMNAYPPPVFVTNGPYRIVRHPVYWGFGLLVTGFFIFTGSASGFWLVTPVTILGMVALVLGYESIDLKKRFPGQSISTILDYPESRLEIAGPRDRLTSLLRLGSLLVTCNFIIIKLHGNVLPLTGGPLRIIGVLENQQLIFLSIVFLMASPFLLRRKDSVRKWEFTGFIGLSASAFLAILFPETGAQYFPENETAYFAIPVFLLFTPVIPLSGESEKKAILIIPVILVLTLIQLINCRSAQLNLVSSVFIYMLASSYKKIWSFLKNMAEKVANSWKEWVFGKVRIINHGFYVGTGTFLGIFLAGTLAGREYAFPILVFTLIVNTCAGLWAQLIEGSPRLKRPFGYYGGLFGMVFGGLAVWAMGANAWVVIGAGAVVMPWIQAIGRLRCLVNGCCHGRKTDNPAIGIRYFHPRSRVCNISDLKGELLHPTQLYSILWLTVTGILILALWLKGSPLSIMIGLYLILTSLGRFVEEGYRGEVQTPVLRGLHLYQWTAIISFLTGIVFTVIPLETPSLDPGFNWESVISALISGLFVFFVMGVDFPYSNVRFSRLV
jgi:prolipoprotein diacylglyceryltransferase